MATTKKRTTAAKKTTKKTVAKKAIAKKAIAKKAVAKKATTKKATAKATAKQGAQRRIKNVPIMMWVTADEKAILEEAARQFGLPLSTWVRWLALRKAKEDDAGA